MNPLFVLVPGWPWDKPPPPEPEPEVTETMLDMLMELPLLAIFCALTIAWWSAAFMWDVFVFKPHTAPPKKRKGYEKWHPTQAGEHEIEGVDAIVIGSGMGGLSCAALLSTFGKRVVVLEQHETVGGGTHCYAVDGKSRWKFDSGLHYTIPQSGGLLAVACGSAKTPVPMSRMGAADGKGNNVYDRILLAGSGQEALDIASEVQMLDELKARFPEERKRIERFVDVAAGLLWRFPIWCLSALLPHALRRPLLASPLFAHWREWAGKTANAALDELFPGDAKGTQMLKSYLAGLWIDAGSPPGRMSFFMAAATSIGFPHVGGAYPDGGPEAMAKALVEAVEGRGGRVYAKASVARIEVAGGKVTGVTMRDGSTLSAPLVVAGCGYRVVGRDLLAPEVAKASGLAPEQLATPQSDSFVMCNIAVEGSAAELGLDCSNLWLQPCNDKNGNSLAKGVDAYFADPLGVDVEQVPLMITFPSTKDRTWEAQHPKETMVQTLALARWDWFSQHQKDDREPSRNAPPHVPREKPEEYAKVKAEWTRRCVEMVQKHFPKITDASIQFSDLSTPLTVENYLPTGCGSAVGLDVTPGRFVDLDAIKRVDMKTAVRGLWLTGQDTLMCGQVLAQMAGVLTALRVVGPFRLTAFVCRVIRFHVATGGLSKKDVSTW